MCWERCCSPEDFRRTQPRRHQPADRRQSPPTAASDTHRFRLTGCRGRVERGQQQMPSWQSWPVPAPLARSARHTPGLFQRLSTRLIKPLRGQGKHPVQPANQSPVPHRSTAPPPPCSVSALCSLLHSAQQLGDRDGPNHSPPITARYGESHPAFQPSARVYFCPSRCPLLLRTSFCSTWPSTVGYLP